MAFKEVTGIDLEWEELSFDKAYEIVLEENEGANNELGRIVDKEIKKETLTTEEFLKLRDAVEAKRKNNWAEVKKAANSRLALEKQSSTVKSTVRRVKRNARKVAMFLPNLIDKGVIAAAEDLSGLMDRILRTNGDLFGGPLMEFVADGVRASTREYKYQRRLQQGIFFDNAQRIFGKKYKKRMRENATIKLQDFKKLMMFY